MEGEGGLPLCILESFPPSPLYTVVALPAKKSSSSYFSGGMEVRAFAREKNVELKDDRSPLSVFG